MYENSSAVNERQDSTYVKAKSPGSLHATDVMYTSLPKLKIRLTLVKTTRNHY